jgi:hypothetical protein
MKVASHLILGVMRPFRAIRAAQQPFCRSGSNNRALEFGEGLNPFLVEAVGIFDVS